MGAHYSYLETEKKTWADHTIVYDENVRGVNLVFLESFKDHADITLASEEITLGGITFKHWFVTDGKLHLEFGHSKDDLYKARVAINSFARESYLCEEIKEMNPDVRNRMQRVVGMSNFSLCLRNSEHVANYVFHGRWFSSQMDDNGILIQQFRPYIKEGSSHKVKVNTFPSFIGPDILGCDTKKLYSFLDHNFVAQQINYYLEPSNNSYNIIVMGPSGAGKSHLINAFFNQIVCDSNVSHKGVSKDIRFVHGSGHLYDMKAKEYQSREITVADTIGFCDSEWDDNQIANFIKGRVHSNFKEIDAVLVVFKVDRLSKEIVEGIQSVMKWLNYDQLSNHLNFTFVVTHAEGLTDAKKTELSNQATEILGLKKDPEWGNLFPNEFVCTPSLIYVGFPHEGLLNDAGMRLVKESWNLLQLRLKHPVSRNRLSNPAFGK